MGFLSADTQKQIKQLFESLSSDVDLTYYTQRESPLFIPGRADCETCKDTRQLLEEVAALSDKLKLSVKELDDVGEAGREHGIDRVPALVVGAEGVKGKIRYFGMPSGTEFPVLLGSLIDASQGKSDLSESSIEALQLL